MFSSVIYVQGDFGSPCRQLLIGILIIAIPALIRILVLIIIAVLLHESTLSAPGSSNWKPTRLTFSRWFPHFLTPKLTSPLGCSRDLASRLSKGHYGACFGFLCGLIWTLSELAKSTDHPSRSIGVASTLHHRGDLSVENLGGIGQLLLR